MREKILRMRLLLGVVVLISVLLIAGCASFTDNPRVIYTAYGQVLSDDIQTDGSGNPILDGDGHVIPDPHPIQGIVIKFDGVVGAVSDAEGKWLKAGLVGDVVVSCDNTVKYLFVPQTISANKEGNKDIDITAYDVNHVFTASGTITKGYGDKSPLAGVMLSYYDINTGKNETVVTDASGQWSILNQVGLVTVTASLDGWQILPASVSLSRSQPTANSLGTDKFYSGEDVISLASLDGFYNNASANCVADSGTIGSDTISCAEAMYLFAKFIVLFNPQAQSDSSLNPIGTIPTQVPYLEITPPTGYTTVTGIDGYRITWSNVLSLATSLTTNHFEQSGQVPNDIQVTLNTSTGSSYGTASVRSDYLVNVLARTVRWINVSGGGTMMPKYSTVYTNLLRFPSTWPTP